MSVSTGSKVTVESIWKLPLLLTGLLVVSLFLIYLPTISSMVRTWNSSETYTHGYLILPISIWLIWQRKDYFSQIAPQPGYFALPLILLVSFGWMIAYFVDVQVVQQLLLVLLIPLIVYSMLGWEVVKAAAFPLFFLIFSVPMGEALVPYLINFTADFTVALVQLTGIPIYREGTFFQLPTGDWSVVEACSGVRYLIASVTLGVLYAYLTYQSTSRRVIFVLVSIVVPIVANGLRAFMIVMIGHFSGMKLATGVDHLIYGWLFFGLVIAIMFYVGSFWREDGSDIKRDAELPADGLQIKVGSANRFLSVFVILLVAVSVFPVKAYMDETDVSGNIMLEVPRSDVWVATEKPVSDWVPRYKNMDASIHQGFRNETEKVDLFIGYYQAQRDEVQLITSTNVMTKEKDEWKKIASTSVSLPLSTGMLGAPLIHLKNENKEILVAYFYYIGGSAVTNKYIAKLVEAKARLLGDDRSSSIIAFSAEVDEDRENSIAAIQAFAKEMSGPIFDTINSVKK